MRSYSLNFSEYIFRALFPNVSGNLVYVRSFESLFFDFPITIGTFKEGVFEPETPSLK